MRARLLIFRRFFMFQYFNEDDFKLCNFKKNMKNQLRQFGIFIKIAQCMWN